MSALYLLLSNIYDGEVIFFIPFNPLLEVFIFTKKNCLRIWKLYIELKSLLFFFVEQIQMSFYYNSDKKGYLVKNSRKTLGDNLLSVCCYLGFH